MKFRDIFTNNTLSRKLCFFLLSHFLRFTRGTYVPPPVHATRRNTNRFRTDSLTL